MIRLCFFARFREKLGVSEENFPLDNVILVEALLSTLARRGDHWQDLFDCPKGVLVAINQQMATFASEVRPGDEVALFPPVTGG